MAPAILVGQLVDQLRPHLEATGDWEQVLELSQATLSRGSGAAGQRRAYGRRGELTDIVDALLAHTQGRTPAHEPPVSVPIASELLTAYHPEAYDEAVSQGGMVLPHYGWMFRALDRLGPRGLAAAQSALHSEQRARGVTFRVADGEPDRLFPLDLVPRIITSEDWAGLTAGLTQRVRALEAFLRDVYGERQIIADGVIPARIVRRRAGLEPAGQAVPGRRGADRGGRASTWSATTPSAGWCWRTTCGCRPASATRSCRGD